jgi:kynurenine formamidase
MTEVGIAGPASGEGWWPSPFGEDDQLGMLNHITDESRRQALASVRLGRLYDLGRVLDGSVPAFPGRHFRQTLVTTAHHVNARDEAAPTGLGDNHVNWITEIVSGTTQLGTHLDALCHLQVGDRGYNGWTVGEIAESWGANRLGAETIPQIVTRGWLVDVVSARGRGLSSGDVVTIEDVLTSLDGAEPEPGDAVLFHTGWGSRWSDAQAYLAGEPGPGVDLAAWLADHGVAVTGADTWSFGPVPAEDPNCPFLVPQMLNVRHGVFVVENLDTAALAADGVNSFAFVLTHPKLRGATGAWVSPIALV